MNDPRYRFDLFVSPGQEIGATIDEYIDYAAARPSTKAIALFMETARNPARFRSSLKRARDAGLPVVVCKVGRSAEAPGWRNPTLARWPAQALPMMPSSRRAARSVSAPSTT